MFGADTAAMDFSKFKSRLVRFGDLAFRASVLMMAMIFLLFRVVSDPVSAGEFALLVAYQLPPIFLNGTFFAAAVLVLAFAACFAVFWRPLVFVPVVFVAAVVAGLLAHSSVMGVYDKWFPADVVAPVGLPIYEVTKKDVNVPFFDMADQVSTVADLLEVDVSVVQASVDESLELMEEGAQYVVIPISCDLPLESSLAAASFLHPGHMWESRELENKDFYAFGIDLAPGFDEVATTASASWDVTGSFLSGVKADIEDNDCSFNMMGFSYDFEVVGYTDVSRSAADARRDVLDFHKTTFEYPSYSFSNFVNQESGRVWLPARITYVPEVKWAQNYADGPYLVYPAFFVGDDEIFGRYYDAYAPVDPAVAAEEIDSMKSYSSMLD